ncbi:11S globulin seed storage protein 2-like [Magnolia sinica]|uniref:11S globulin seed storage protein 2-like n=1 Tax=Magnolia sinica TaxID=86752 RepID=UPI0026587B66|nr:11S globulin seed storage protein 2-like [Magnolia sinica]
MGRPSLLLVTLCFAFITVAHLVVGQTQQSQESQRRLQDAQQCRIQRLSATRPARRIESEGGITELWDENDDQFQCAGVAAMRNIIRPSSLSLPNMSPSPRLVYIQQGRGVLGITYPGCAETYHSRGQPQRTGSEQQQQRGESIRDQHQKIHRIRRGDIVALPAGVAHWCYNDGNEELVALSITDFNSESNQLDQRPRSFYFAGGSPQQQQVQQQRREGQHQQREGEENIMQAFNENILAEAFDVSVDIVRKMQRNDDRGYIVKVERREMSMVRPDEEAEDEEQYQRGRRNGFEEVYCNMRLNHYMDNPREADIYSRQAGRLNSVNMNKLPILRMLGMSAEKGYLYQNAIFSPHWTMNAHNIFYVTRGEAHVQVVGHNGQTVLDDTVREGDLVVVPQYFAVMKKAGNNGFEWVSFKTSASPMRSPLAGSTSAIKGMPMEVLTNAYQVSYREAQNLKFNREHQVMFFPPPNRSS